MNNDDFLSGRIRKGHPLLLGTEPVFFRSARMSPHSGSFLVVVADEAGGTLAVEPAELAECPYGRSHAAGPCSACTDS